MRVIEAGGDPAKTIFSGVCKQDWEIRKALEMGVSCFNIESDGELQKISAIAKELDTVARISVRINPDVDAKTHPYISTGMRENKFGLTPEMALQTYRRAASDKHIKVHGVACHIGSQLTDLKPYKDALNRVLHFVELLKAEGIEIHQVDFGGGLGVRYNDEQPPSPKEYWQIIHEQLKALDHIMPVAIEPGRAIAGNAGILLTEVHYIKRNEHANFCVVDAGMNDLIRPALYQAYQEIVEIDQDNDETKETFDVVGPVCESADFLGKQRQLSVKEGDLLAVRTSGAYCAVMSSNYNSRPRPAEVMVDGDEFYVIRERESLEALYASEKILPGSQEVNTFE